MNAVLSFPSFRSGKLKDISPWDFPHACMSASGLKAEVERLAVDIKRVEGAREARREDCRQWALRSATLTLSGLALAAMSNEIGNTITVFGGALATSMYATRKLDDGRAKRTRDALGHQREELELVRSFAEVAGEVTRRHEGKFR